MLPETVPSAPFSETLLNPGRRTLHQEANSKTKGWISCLYVYS